MWETITLLYFWFAETSTALSTFRTSKCTGSGLSTFYIRFAAISVVIQILQTVRPFKLWHWSPCASRLNTIGLILYELVNAWPEFIDLYWMLLHKKKQNDMEQTTTLRKSTNITQNHPHKQNRSRALQISIPHTFKQKNTTDWHHPGLGWFSKPP